MESWDALTSFLETEGKEAPWKEIGSRLAPGAEKKRKVEETQTRDSLEQLGFYPTLIQVTN